MKRSFTSHVLESISCATLRKTKDPTAAHYYVCILVEYTRDPYAEWRLYRLGSDVSVDQESPV
jgi:hypothetical protein